MIIHQRAGLTIVELETTDQTAGLLVSRAYPMFSKSIGSLQQHLSHNELLDIAAKEIRKLTTFDRVLIYRFDRTGRELLWRRRALSDCRLTWN